MFNKKILVSFYLFLVFILSTVSPNVYGMDTSASNKAIKVLVDGKYLDFKTPPVEKDGSTLVPMREIFEALGATLSWNDTTSTATAIKGSTKVVLQLDNLIAYVNESPISLTVPGTLINDKTMVPTRFIAESMNCVVSWDDVTKTVIIKPNTNISFEDKNLEEAIKETLNSSKDIITTRDISDLTSLTLDELNISSIKGLEYAINLNTLNISKNTINNISPLSGLIKLENLNLSQNKITDIKPLTNLVNLRSLKLDNNNISDISSLSDHYMLESLFLGNNKISDESVLKSITNLKHLSLFYTLIDDTTVFSELKNLVELDLSRTQITDISPLRNCVNIQTLYIYDDAVLDLSVLKHLKNLDSFYYDDYYDKTIVNDELFSRSELMINKAKSIISNVIKSEMSDLDKELALHDYIIMNTKYDDNGYINGTVPNQAHMPYGVLIDGVGVCDGISNTMKALLDMVDIKSLTVYGTSLTLTSSPVGHAWNLVNIDGKYYYVDLTWDDTGEIDKVNTISHRYFNLSAKQISIDHKFNRDFYPEANVDNIDFENLIKNENMIVVDTDYTYTCRSGYLYKIDNKTQIAKQLSKNLVLHISYYNSWIYYVNYSDNLYLYKIKDNGTENTLLSKDPSLYLCAVDNSLYYLDKNFNKIRAIDLGTQKVITMNYDSLTTSFYIDGNYLYYKSYNNSNPIFVRYNISTNEKLILLEKDKTTGKSIAGYNTSNGSMDSYTYRKMEEIRGEWIYYISSDDNNKIYKVKSDGSQITKVSTDSVYNYKFTIAGEWIYYINASDSNRYYKVRTDGTQNSAIIEE